MVYKVIATIPIIGYLFPKSESGRTVESNRFVNCSRGVDVEARSAIFGDGLVRATSFPQTLLIVQPNQHHPVLELQFTCLRSQSFCSRRWIDEANPAHSKNFRSVKGFLPAPMTSPEDAAPVKPPPSFSGAPIAVPNSRFDADSVQSSSRLSSEIRESSVIGSPRTSFPPRNEPQSRSSSPSNRLSGSASLPQRLSLGSPLGSLPDSPDNTRSLIIRSFAPAIGVFASDDTEDLIRQKGFKDGLRELLRPFGENITGKVVIRDSTGMSRTWEDYGVRFVNLASRSDRGSHAAPTSPLVQLEEVLQRRLDSTDDSVNRLSRHSQVPLTNKYLASPLYQLLLRRTLSIDQPTAHETFLHPVACVIAISSHNKAPLESLRQLYAQTNQGNTAPPLYVHPEFLRYYVLVHDEDRSDIAESTKLYDQMKRHFGLHCHLLRLRSDQCVVTDDDSLEVPSCEWLSPDEDLLSMNENSKDLDLDLLCLADTFFRRINRF